MIRETPYGKAEERELIGGILVQGTEVMNIVFDNKVNEDFFHYPLYKVVFGIAATQMNTHGIVDLSAIIKAVGDDNYPIIEEAMDSCMTITHTEYLCDRLKEFRQRRGIIQTCGDLMNDAYATGDGVEQLRSKAELAISRLSLKQSVKSDASSMIDEVITDWETAREKGTCIGVQTGFRAIDLFFGGLMKSSFYILSGAPGSCKTTLARNIVEHVAEMGIQSSILSLEQTGTQIWGSIIARFAKQSLFRLNCGSKNVSIDEIRNWRDFTANLPINVEERSHSISETLSWGRREVAGGAKLLVVDYIQRIQGDRGVKYGSEEARVAQTSTALADLAKETGGPVLAISSLSRAGNLRGSGTLEYDAYCMLNIAKAEDWRVDNLVYAISFQKQRFGPPAADVRMLLLGDEGRLVDEIVDVTVKECERHYQDVLPDDN